MTTDYARSDVYPPEVEALGEMRTCTDRNHVRGCPCGVGADPILRTADDERCGLCNRLTFGDAVTVDFDTRGLTAVCSVCWEKQDVMVPLDYTTDEGDDDA